MNDDLLYAWSDRRLSRTQRHDAGSDPEAVAALARDESIHRILECALGNREVWARAHARAGQSRSWIFLERILMATAATGLMGLLLSAILFMPARTTRVWPGLQAEGPNQDQTEKADAFLARLFEKYSKAERATLTVKIAVDDATRSTDVEGTIKLLGRGRFSCSFDGDAMCNVKRNEGGFSFSYQETRPGHNQNSQSSSTGEDARAAAFQDLLIKAGPWVPARLMIDDPDQEWVSGGEIKKAAWEKEQALDKRPAAVVRFKLTNPKAEIKVWADPKSLALLKRETTLGDTIITEKFTKVEFAEEEKK